MKKLILIVVSFLSINCFAGSADMFALDEQSLEQEFASLNALENFVVGNNHLSLNDIKQGNLFDLSAINTNSMGATSSSEFVFQWEGFLWGFLCCPVGFFVIAVNQNKDYDQKLSYWIGVAAGTFINIIYYVAAGGY